MKTRKNKEVIGNKLKIIEFDTRNIEIKNRNSLTLNNLNTAHYNFTTDKNLISTKDYSWTLLNPYCLTIQSQTNKRKGEKIAAKRNTTINSHNNYSSPYSFFVNQKPNKQDEKSIIESKRQFMKRMEQILINKNHNKIFGTLVRSGEYKENNSNYKINHSKNIKFPNNQSENKQISIMDLSGLVNPHYSPSISFKEDHNYHEDNLNHFEILKTSSSNQTKFSSINYFEKDQNMLRTGSPTLIIGKFSKLKKRLCKKNDENTNRVNTNILNFSDECLSTETERNMFRKNVLKTNKITIINGDNLSKLMNSELKFSHNNQSNVKSFKVNENREENLNYHEVIMNTNVSKNFPHNFYEITLPNIDKTKYQTQIITKPNKTKHLHTKPSKLIKINNPK